MRKTLQRWPSPALVVACIALGVALGGTSVAAVSQLGRNTVGTTQLKNAAVTNPKLRNASVTSAKVANRSLLRADFAPGQLSPGPVGPVGPAGPAGPAGPPGLSAVERIELASASTSTTSKSAQLPCPAGKRLIGGGARVTGNVSGLAIQASFPDNDNIYRAVAREVVANPASWVLTVYAICAVAP